MSELKSARQRLVALQREKEKVEQQIQIEDITKKISGTEIAILDNEQVHKCIETLSKDEVKIVMKNLYTSSGFAELFSQALSDSENEIAEMKQKKAERKEARKQKKQVVKTSANDLDFSNGTGFPQSVKTSVQTVFRGQ